ncbi:hypothetical protein QAD02_003492 [Eretmocerus hayati]|uniref:Uncharacterized protein n=1 Tax=Eretmocerus hayati TaxID=131215 RepID=A0ACC2NLZ9_9HYME|nr:hypothetical protein QAD02_003492 [Eretmocerus hayati]
MAVLGFCGMINLWEQHGATWDSYALIELYFKQNCTQEEIIALLEKNHGVIIKRRTLKRRMPWLGLRRNSIVESDINDICSAIVTELQSCGFNLGYRAMWQKFLHVHKLRVKRDTVYKLLKIADPEGVEERKANRLKRRVFSSKGSNHIWSLDGYDKLKPFGFPIHGCIDRFSRYVLWLQYTTTNNDPKVPAYLFLQAVKKLKGLPTLVRTDAGTENVNIHSLQTCLRAGQGDDLEGDKSYIVGRSVHNQRIESYWGQMRQHSMDSYIHLFTTLKDNHEFDGSERDTKCLQFCFASLIQSDLDKCRDLWNKHSIRKQNANNIHGKPYSMYHLPEKYGAQDCKKPVDLNAVDRLFPEFTEEPQLYDPFFAQQARYFFPNLRIPSNVDEALALYRKLKQCMDES